MATVETRFCRSHGIKAIWEAPVRKYFMINGNRNLFGGGYRHRPINSWLTRKIMNPLDTRFSRPLELGKKLNSIYMDRFWENESSYRPWANAIEASRLHKSFDRRDFINFIFAHLYIYSLASFADISSAMLGYASFCFPVFFIAGPGEQDLLLAGL